MNNTLKTLIEKVQSKADEIRYYNGKIEDPGEFLDTIVKGLEAVQDEHEFCSTPEQLEEAEEIAAQSGFKQAKERIIETVLKNSVLKRRGDMIAAVEKMEHDE